MIVVLVCMVVFMMTMERMSEMVIFVPFLFFFSVAFTRTPVMCTLRFEVPFTMTIIEMVSSFYIDNFVVGFLRVAIGMSFLVLNGIVMGHFVVVMGQFMVILVSCRMSHSSEFVV